MIAVIDFLNPWALAFLGLVPILILLYFLKLKRPRIKIASTLLWQKVLEDVRVNSPFQRLKRSLLLLLPLSLLLVNMTLISLMVVGLLRSIVCLLATLAVLQTLLLWQLVVDKVTTSSLLLTLLTLWKSVEL